MSRFAVVFVLSLVACSKSKPKDEAVGSASGAPPAVVIDAPSAAPADAPTDATDLNTSDAAVGSGSDASASVDFDKLSHDEQVKFMKTKVNPPMKAAFQKFDPKDYASFGCKTCHGKNPQKTKYKMPNPELKPLDFAAIKAGKEDPKMLDFMSKVVKPEMAKILGKPEMTETQDGFGCLDCHTQKKPK